MATQLKKLWKFATTYDLLKLEKPGEATEAGVAIAFPLAYLESLNELAQTNDLLQQISATSISEPVQQQSEKLGLP